MNFEPLADRILVKRDDVQTMTSGGLHIPTEGQKAERPYQGRILAVGPGVRTPMGGYEPLPVKVDDTVVYGKYSGTEIKLDDEPYMILSISDVLGVLR